jgi:HlyD family secretion protein
MVGAITVAVLGFIVWSSLPEPAPVETAHAEYGPLAVTIDEDGRTRVADRYIVTAPVAGRLERIDLREGMRVTAGQVVARMQPLPLDERTREQLEAQRDAAAARVRAAQAALTRAEAAHVQARRELERRQRLAEQGAIAAEQVEQYQLAERARFEEVAAARESATAAQSDLDAAGAALVAASGESTGAAISVRAPADGEVLRIPERSARIVSPGEPLVELGGTGVLEAVVDVLSTDAVRIRTGMPVRFVGWGGSPLQGSVRRVEPSAFTKVSALGVEEQRVNVILDIDDCPPELGDGYRVEVEITIWQEDRVLTVPSSALFREGEEWRTFALVDGRAVLRPVVPGERSGASTQILSGLEEGDQVILFPSDAHTDGASVRPIEEAINEPAREG